MPQDPNAPQSRRRVLIAATGGVAALAASRLASPIRVAAVSVPVNLNEDNASTAVTSISQGTTDTDAFAATADGAGTGITGTSDTGVGVKAVNGATNLPAMAALQGDLTGSTWALAEDMLFGTYGFSNEDISSVGVFGESGGGVGVAGFAFDTGGLGVLGIGSLGGWIEGSDGAYVLSDSNGVGLQAHTGSTPSVPVPPANTAIFASVETTSQVGLEAQGRIKFTNRSGRAKILKNQSSVSVTVPGVASGMFAFAVLNASRTGRWVRAAAIATNKLTIYLNTSVTSDTYVSWLILG